MDRTVIALLSLLLVLVDCVQINYKDICGNKLHDSCPNAVNTKIVGGDSSCSEKVPWNVLVEKIDAGQTDGKVGFIEQDRNNLNVENFIQGASLLWWQFDHLPTCPLCCSLLLDQ